MELQLQREQSYFSMKTDIIKIQVSLQAFSNILVV